MTLYHEAASFIDPQSQQDRVGGSLKSRIYGNANLKHNPTHIYALISETSKCSAVLSSVIETAGLLEHEKKLNPTIALLACHDLLLAKKGIALSKGHSLRQAVEKHRPRLQAELTRARIQAGFPSLQAWRDAINAGVCADGSSLNPDSKPPSCRWIRINSLSSSLDRETTEGSLKEWDRVPSLSDILTCRTGQPIYFVDDNVPSLVAVPAPADMTKHVSYRTGRIILQDKASCFPALLLSPGGDDNSIMDACAAPGNKTTHLAAIWYNALDNSANDRSMHARRLIAVERDSKRSETLRNMVITASAQQTVSILPKQDFLKLDPDSFPGVNAILLDPSCSGSGILGRHDDSAGDSNPKITLPRRKAYNPDNTPHSLKQLRNKRKRTQQNEDRVVEATSQSFSPSPTPIHNTSLRDRLIALSNFQLLLIKHAFRFTDANRVVYSTCSIHTEEDEYVAVRALMSAEARSRGWRVLRREEQVGGLRGWGRRGESEAVRRMVGEVEGQGAASGRLGDEWIGEVAEACLRCDKGTEEGTMGFFAVGFVRDGASDVQLRGIRESSEEEWEGLSESSP